jgi:two-component system chemotaxis response regulator CheY
MSLKENYRKAMFQGKDLWNVFLSNDCRRLSCNALICTAHSRYVRTGSGTCVEAGDGRQALQLLKERHVDVILSDTNMPNMNGEELVRCLQADPVMKRIPVVVVSTDRTETRLQQMISVGARGYVAKPFFPEALRAELQRVLEVMHECS